MCWEGWKKEPMLTQEFRRQTRNLESNTIEYADIILQHPAEVSTSRSPKWLKPAHLPTAQVAVDSCGLLAEDDSSPAKEAGTHSQGPEFVLSDGLHC